MLQPRYYFAYGSNMGRAQMMARCPNSKRLGVAALLGYRWIIAADGYANAVVSPADVMEGVLFDISPADEAKLDICEEVGAGCYAKHVVAVQYAGATVYALIYRNQLTVPGTAAPDYLEPLRTALFADGGLSDAYLERHILPFIQP
jgi:hypothetical protein